MPAAVAPARPRPGGPRAGGPAACGRPRGPPPPASAGPKVPIPVPGWREPRTVRPLPRTPAPRSTPALRAASSASPAITPAGNRVRSSCAVAPSPFSPRPTHWSDRTRAARSQSWAAWACRTASTGYPWPAYQPAAAACSTGSSVRRAAPQLKLQEVGEQLVVAEPGPPRIQRDHEHAGLLELLQDPLPARAPGQQVGQLAVYPVSSTLVRSSSRRTSSGCRSSTSASRYSATVRSLPENSAANRSGSGCPASDSAASRSPATQPSVRSYSSPSAESGQRYPGRLEQRLRLVQREAQIGRADLGELSLQPQPVQAQPQIVAGGEHEPQLAAGGA